jgi:hypothetical protein
MTEQQLEAIRSMVRHYEQSGYYSHPDGYIAIFNPDNRLFLRFEWKQYLVVKHLVLSGTSTELGSNWKFNKMEQN